MSTMLSSLSLLAFIALANIALVAEEPPRFAGPPCIATVDIDKVVRESREYQTKLAALRDAVEEAKAGRLRGERDELKRIADRLKTFKPGSPEQRAAEEALGVGKGCGIDLRKENAKREFDQSAARLFAEFRVKAVVEIAAYAREQQLQLVINRTPSESATNYATTGENVGCRLDCWVVNNAPPTSRVVYSACPDITSTITERLDTASP